MSTGGILPSIPEPVDPVGNAAHLRFNTVSPAPVVLGIRRRLATDPTGPCRGAEELGKLIKSYQQPAFPQPSRLQNQPLTTAP
jgi:hypothetical protein